MRKRKIGISIALVVILVAAVVLVLNNRNRGESSLPDEVFGPVIQPGTRYYFQYSSDPEVYYTMLSGGMPTGPVFEDFINDLTSRLNAGTGYGSVVYNQYKKEYTDDTREAQLLELAHNYDLKIVNVEENKETPKVKYNLFIRGRSWCITDAEGRMIYGWPDYFGSVIKDIVEEIRFVGSGGNIPLQAPSPGRTPNETGMP